jgi:hypothetical protein
MGLSESVIKSLTGPCEKSVHDCQKYTMDNMECSSDCKCCNFQLKTHPHKTDNDEFESVSEETVEHPNDDT